MKGFEQFASNRLVGSSLEMSSSSSKKRRGEPRQEVEDEEEGSPRRKSGAATSVTVELDVLDCPVCWEPLRPPIFQCTVGHLICSSCCENLPKTKTCHYCSRKSDYNRCHGIEKIIASIQVPCSNTKYGCSMKTSYYQREHHERACPHAPCFCPDTGCSFSGSTAMLLDHFVAEHLWPSTKFKYGWSFYVEVKEGPRAISDEDGQLFLLNVATEPFGCVVSAFSVQPHDAEPKFRCALSFSSWKKDLYHNQSSSEFEVPRTTLSEGIPRDRFLFIVPKFYLGEDSKICVTMKKASVWQT